MWHLSMAWMWIMGALALTQARLAAPAALGWMVVILPLCCLGWQRSPWRALLRPQRGVKLLCWVGHALMVGPLLLVLGLLAMPSLDDGHAYGAGLMLALLLTPLPWIGAAAWMLQIAGLLRRQKTRR